MVTKNQVISALRKCFDPEMPVNIVDLGLVDGIKINKNRVEVKIILTSPLCPMKSFILDDIKDKISRIKGVKGVDVKLSSKKWSPDRMSKKLKVKMGWC